MPAYVYFQKKKRLQHITDPVRGARRPKFPTDPFAILEPPNQSIDELYVAQKRRSTEFWGSEIEKGSVVLPWLGLQHTTRSSQRLAFCRTFSLTTRSLLWKKEAVAYFKRKKLSWFQALTAEKLRSSLRADHTAARCSSTASYYNVSLC